MPSLYLTPFEQKLLRSDLLQEWKWELKEEKLEACETPAELDKRMKLLARGKNPQMEKLVQKINAKLDLGEKLTELTPEGVSDDAFALLLFGIGALGMTALVELLLRDAKSQDDLFDIAAITNARHALMKANRSTMSSAS